LQTMDVGLGSFGVFFMAATTRFHGIGADFGDHAFVRLLLVIGAGRAAMTGDAADLSMNVAFDKLVSFDINLFPYLQRRQFTRSPFTFSLGRFYLLRLFS